MPRTRRTDKDGKVYEMMKFIIQCNVCNCLVESISKDDYVTCTCKNLTIRGGVENDRFISCLHDLITDVSEWKLISIYSIDTISVYIFNWKKVTDNSLKLYEKIKSIISDTTIVNCDETRPIDAGIQLDDSHYYGSQYNHAIKHVKPGNIFCVIVGDNIHDNNFEVIFNSALNTFNSHNVGIYGIDDKRSSHKTVISNYIDSLFNVENTDCGFWFINPSIVSSLKHLDYSASKYGWWIDKLTINYAKSHNFLILRDYSVSTDQLDHTCGYPRSEAILAATGLLDQFNLIE